MSEILGVIIATLITLAVFSRVWRNNDLFRAAEHLLLGALAGYTAAVVVRTVLWPGLVLPLLGHPLKHVWLIFPLALILLLALRFARSERLQAAGLLPFGLLLGAGGALALAGSLRGTLVPQLLASAEISFLPVAPPWLDTLAVVIATLTTIAVLLYFQQRARPQEFNDFRPLSMVAKLGYLVLMLGLGALLASTAGARITLLIDRVHYLSITWEQLLGAG